MMIEPQSSNTSSWLPAALTAFGGFATAVLSLIGLRFSDARKDERAYQREKEARDVQRRDAWTQRRNEFQTKTLIDLQDEAEKWLRSIREVHFLQRLRFETTGNWPDVAMPSELSERVSNGTAQVDKLSSRVRDEKVRSSAKRLKGELAKVLEAQGSAASERGMIDAGSVFHELNDRIGVLLRDLDLFES